MPLAVRHSVSAHAADRVRFCWEFDVGGSPLRVRGGRAFGAGGYSSRRLSFWVSLRSCRTPSSIVAIPKARRPRRPRWQGRLRHLCPRSVVRPRRRPPRPRKRRDFLGARYAQYGDGADRGWLLPLDTCGESPLMQSQTTKTVDAREANLRTPSRTSNTHGTSTHALLTPRRGRKPGRGLPQTGCRAADQTLPTRQTGVKHQYEH